MSVIKKAPLCRTLCALTAIIISVTCFVSCGVRRKPLYTSKAASTNYSSAINFELPDLDGRIWRLSDQKRPVVICFFCGCSNCEKFAGLLHKTRLDNRHKMVLAVCSGGRDTATRLKLRSGLVCPILVDESATTTEQYSALNCPQIRLIGGDNQIIFAGDGTTGSLEKLTATLTSLRRRYKGGENGLFK